ncbi:hypothetical protein C5167_034463 [Papaver somniferum]|uniref:Uncharacterized protein n=1 Tax=Papaver somniferum TaxID=3469 RepID=A0A4Y7KGT8_PAPSO|nr:hypothetical protein C5167_034463 [Papaver somniferum]
MAMLLSRLFESREAGTIIFWGAQAQQLHGVDGKKGGGGHQANLTPWKERPCKWRHQVKKNSKIYTSVVIILQSKANPYGLD